jgi:hypothetical protein
MAARESQMVRGNRKPLQHIAKLRSISNVAAREGIDRREAFCRNFPLSHQASF